MCEFLELCLYGSVSARLQGGQALSLDETHKALLGALALTPDGRRAATWLQDALWTGLPPQEAAGKLHAALASLRARLGPCGDILSIDGRQVRLDPTRLRLRGGPQDGALLGGAVLPGAQGLRDWLGHRRRTAALPTATVADIAVLPFRASAFGAPPSLLGDALAEDVARRLSRSAAFDVISHLCARELLRRGGGVSAANALGIRCLVSGVVDTRAAGIDCIVDLHDLDTGRLIWSRCWRRPHDEPFLRAESITSEIAAAVARSTALRPARDVRARPIEPLAGREQVIAAIAPMHGHDPARFLQAGALLAEALCSSPDMPSILAWKAKWHALRMWRGLSPAPAQDRSDAWACTARALDADPDCGLALAVEGALSCGPPCDAAVAEARYRRALDIDPSDAYASLLLGALQTHLGRAEDAVRLTERARHLSPLDPERHRYDALGAAAYLCAGRPSDALALAERSLRAAGHRPCTLRARVAALHMLDRGEDARAAAADLLEMEPDLTVGGYLARHPMAEGAVGKLFAAALAAAGVPR